MQENFKTEVQIISFPGCHAAYTCNYTRQHLVQVIIFVALQIGFIIIIPGVPPPQTRHGNKVHFILLIAMMLTFK